VKIRTGLNAFGDYISDKFLLLRKNLRDHFCGGKAAGSSAEGVTQLNGWPGYTFKIAAGNLVESILRGSDV